MKFEFIAAENANYPVKALCRCLGVTAAGYYAWRARPKARREHIDGRLLEEVRASHVRSKGRYGSPRIFHDLRRRGHCVSRKRVARLMREEGLFGRKRRRFKATTDSRHDDPIAPNLLKRQFTAKLPGQVMVGDTTAIETREGFLYLAVLLDLCTRAIVGWSTSKTNDTELVKKAFQQAVKRGFRRGFLHHTDRGSTYAAKAYREMVEATGGRRSMSRKGDCFDNAVAESVFRTIKEEGIGEDTPETVSEARLRLVTFIEGFYNTKRLHSSLGYQTPYEFEKVKLESVSRIRKLR